MNFDGNLAHTQNRMLTFPFLRMLSAHHRPSYASDFSIETDALLLNSDLMEIEMSRPDLVLLSVHAADSLCRGV